MLAIFFARVHGLVWAQGGVAAETPSPHTDYGIKGVGERGAIPPPAAIFNAVNDALRGLGVEFNETPLTPPTGACAV